jgi:hypothetical protein
MGMTILLVRIRHHTGVWGTSPRKEGRIQKKRVQDRQIEDSKMDLTLEARLTFFMGLAIIRIWLLAI